LGRIGPYAIGHFQRRIELIFQPKSGPGEMRRQLGHGISHGVLELDLREIAGFQQIGAIQSRAGEPGPG
jgi:hypothetical protein